MDSPPKSSRGLNALRKLVFSAALWLVRSRVLPDFNPRWVLGGIGAALLAVGCVVTATARPSSLPLGGSSWSRWLTSTLETAPYTRLTFTNASFNAVAVSPDETTIWALGDNGLALRSNDRGRSWTWVRISPSEAPALPASVKEAPNAAVAAAVQQSVAQQAPAQSLPIQQVSNAVPRYVFGRNSASLPGNVFGPLELSIKELASAYGPVYVTPFRTADEPNGLAVERGQQIVGILAKMGLPENRIQTLQPIVSTTPGVDVGLVRPTVAQVPVQPAPPSALQIQLPSPQTQSQQQISQVPATNAVPNFAFGCMDADNGFTAISGATLNVWKAASEADMLSADPAPPDVDLANGISSGTCMLRNVGERLVIVGENLPTSGWPSQASAPSYQVYLQIDNARKQTTLGARSTGGIGLPEGTYNQTLPAGNYVVNGGFVGARSLRRWVVTSDARLFAAAFASTEPLPAITLTNANGQPETRSLNAIYFMDDDLQGWVVGDDGLVYRSTDSGAAWSPAPSLIDQSVLKAVVFLSDGATGWAAGEGGLYGSDDGGTTWSPVAILSENLSPWLETRDSFRLTDMGALQRCAAGETAETCVAVPTNALFPAPLALFAFVSAFLTLTLAGFAPDRIVPEDETAEREGAGSASAYASDRPLTQGDFDLLNLGGIARGLAEFLVNRRTEPPLSVAVDGPWGSGKSSLLNLFVGGEATRRRFRIVWFNAWHHEREENTLGAILEMLCRDAIPAFASPFGLAMRFKLLWSKIKERPLAYLGGLSVVVFVATISITNPRIPVELLEPALAVIAGAFGVEASGAANTEDIQWLVRWGGGIFAALYVLFNLQTKLFALAKTADGVLPRIIFTPGRKALMTDVGLRNRFAREFAAVTKAMRPMRLIIVIDDLDRCQPAKVVEILQLVNFLMTSGECFVIAAADLNFVEACVRQEYEEVGGLLFSANGADQSKEASERNLAEFAHRYLRKIVNVVVRVPRMTAEQSKAFVNEDAIREVRDRRKDKRRNPLLYAAWAAVAVVAVVGPLLLAEQIALDAALVDKQPEQVQTSTATATGPAPAATPGGTAAPVTPVEPPRPPLQVRTAETPGPASWWWYLLPVAILAYFMRVAWQIWRIVEATRKTDSKAFTDALTRWVPLVYEQTPTPRDIRRFTNQARYLAAQNAHSGASRLSDEQLVKFAALEFVDHDWFDELDEAAVSRLEQAKTNDERKLPEHWSAELKKAAHQAFASATSLGAPQRKGSIEDFRKVATRSKWR